MSFMLKILNTSPSLQFFTKNFVFTARFCATHVPLENCSFSEKDLCKFEPLFQNNEKKDAIMEILNEYNVKKVKGKKVPSELSLEMMQELLLLESRTQRLKYLQFQFKNEMTRINKKIKQQRKREDKLNANINKVNTCNHINYKLGHNSILIRIQPESIRKWCNLRQLNSVLFGQKIVLDLSYEEFMMRKDVRNCAKQLIIAFSDNSTNKSPYDVYVCNAKKESFSVECLEKDFISHKVGNFISCTELSYLDLFPKEKLVYLSPHAEEKLTHYDHDAIYIIGAFVDVSKQYKISHNKAHNEGIKSYALPLDEYIMWGCGNKSLSINQVFRIMLEMKNTNDWKKAFEFVPDRKLKRIDIKTVNIEELPDKLYLQQKSKINSNNEL